MTAVLQEPTRKPEPAVMAALPGGRLKARVEQVVLGAIIAAPVVALAVLVPVLWGTALLQPRDLVIGFVLYAITGHGITVGFHRLFTHGSFKPVRSLKIALAVAGSMAVEGPVSRWVADHRRHHAFSDHEGDPHSPHLHGEGFVGLAKGLLHAHMGWLFDAEQTNQRRFVPDLLADKDLRVISKLFGPLVAASLILPAVLGYLLSGFTLEGALSAFLWAGVIRIALLHHVTWSINSICHTWGKRPFQTRDQSRNVWALAIVSMGESWHNLHHSDPTAARHGVDRFQLDSSARIIRWFEQLHLAKDVRWSSPERLAKRRVLPVA